MYQYLLIAIVLLTWSCGQEEGNDCFENIANIEDWKPIFDKCDEGQICSPSVFKAKYLNSVTVYYIELSGPLCDTFFQITLLTCEGEIIKTITDIDEFKRNVSSIELIRKCS